MYERVGGERDERWLGYSLGVSPRHADCSRRSGAAHGRDLMVAAVGSGLPVYWAGTAGGVFAVRGDSPIER